MSESNFSKSIVNFKKRIFTKKITNLMRTKEMLKFEVSINSFSKEEKCRRLLKNS